jgi:transaldolase
MTWRQKPRQVPPPDLHNLGQSLWLDNITRGLLTRQKSRDDTCGEKLFFELAIEDLRQAAALFRPVHDATQGLDGWVSLEVSPLLANDTAATIKEAAALHAQAHISNLLMKIPGTPEGTSAIEASIAAGVPVNVTLLFSREQYLAAADA